MPPPESATPINPEGWYPQAQRIDSPNYDARPAHNSDGSPCEIDTLVIHAISLPPAGIDPDTGTKLDSDFSGHHVEDFFCNQLDPRLHPYFETLCDVEVSAHFYIRRSGELIQFVSTENRAWHAGASRFNGRERVNDFSIGIELEGCDTLPFEPAQYQQLAQLSQSLMATYPGITPAQIIGHSDIAPERKTDPGPCFDWRRYRQLIT